MAQNVLSITQLNEYIRGKMDADALLNQVAVRGEISNYKQYPGLEVVFSGGVASNSMLRELTNQLKPVFALPQYSTDNAMGVAILAHRLLEG